MTRSEALALLVAPLLAACGAAGRPPPRPTAVSPAIGFSTADAAVEIAGDDFHVRAVQRADGGGSSVDAGYRAWLGGVELLEVTWANPRLLTARVPAGLAVGGHDLAVEGPFGTGGLAGAYQVIAGLPPALAISVTAPAEVAIGEPLQVTVRASNTGTWIVDGIAPAVSATGTGAVDPVPVSLAPQDLLAGSAHDFIVPYTATRAGAVSVFAAISGTDPRTGATVSAAATTDVVVRPAPSVAVVAADPFQDGSTAQTTAFAFVASYGGRLIVGPNHTGRALFAMDPDGGATSSLALAIARDTTGNQSSNTAWQAPLPGTYPSIGFTGCTPNSAVNPCGPDDENGRGFMTSVTFAGDEWLVLGGARSGGDLDYVYLSRGATSPLAFSFVDLSAVLGPATRGFSAVAAAGGRLYLGFPDDGGSRPYCVALLTPPTAPGLNAVAGTHVIDLNLHDVYNTIYNRFSAISMVDAIGELDGRLYFFNDSGCVVSRDLAPVVRTDFAACSPAEGAAYAQADSLPPSRMYDLTPADRAWPAAVAWKGRLFAIRNTTTGPQLWRCDPAAGTDPLGCDRADWTLVAADASTGYRTRFGKPGARAATLLLATATHLWVGLDDDSGVHLFRTAADAPAFASDFVGQGGCIAGTPGCEGFGGDGFGAPGANTRFLDAKVVTWSGGTDLVLAVGDGSGPVKIVRVAP
jgi:hypothetical protein